MLEHGPFRVKDSKNKIMVTLTTITESLTKATDATMVGPESFVEVITPETAETLLMLNVDYNRQVRKANVRKFAEAMKRMEFFQGGAIRLAKERGGKYHLVDGQHRLQAVIESGIPQTFTVTVAPGDAAREYAMQDQYGQKRSTADAIRALRPSSFEKIHASVYGSFLAALKVIACNFDFSWAGEERSMLMRTEQIAALHDEYLDALEIIESAPKESKTMASRGIYRAPVLAVALATAKYAERRLVQDFWGQVVDDNGLMRRDPRKHLNMFLGTSSSSGRYHRVRAVCAATKCWNSWALKKEIKQLKLSSRNIKIAMTPFPYDAEEDEAE